MQAYAQTTQTPPSPDTVPAPVTDDGDFLVFGLVLLAVAAVAAVWWFKR
jgi:hypothetical protein